MVKLSYPPSSSKTKSSLLQWWRGGIGALLTFLIVVPYMMGADVEKYLRGWMTAVNQRNGNLHLELLNYQRHWFTSDGDLTITGTPLRDKITVHFKAYHGPLFFNAGPAIRCGLGFLKGTIDSRALLGEQTVLKIDGPIQLTAFVPYFSDRELHAILPPLTITDKENSLAYRLETVEGKLDSDGLLQMELPLLSVSRLNGTVVLDMNAGLLRIIPDNRLAFFSVKQININLKKNGPATLSNFVMQANAQNNNAQADRLTLDLNLHFDQFKKPLDNATATAPTLLEAGPFEFKLKINGLQREGFITVTNLLKALSTQKTDLTPEQGEALEKGLSNIFSPDTVFELSSDLATSNGKLSAQFQGGFNSGTAKAPRQNLTDLVDAFYSKGTIELATELMQALSNYAASQPEKNVSSDSSDARAVLPSLLGFLKKNTAGYSARVDIHDGRISLNGKDLKPEKS